MISPTVYRAVTASPLPTSASRSWRSADTAPHDRGARREDARPSF
jgi:hypothetical protein